MYSLYRLKIIYGIVCFLITSSNVIAQQQEQASRTKKSETTAKIINLPDDVIKAIMQEYPGYRVKSAEKIVNTQQRKKQVYYIIFVEKGDEFYKMNVSADGAIISRSWLTFYEIKK